MENHPIEGLMLTAMNSIKDMIDVIKINQVTIRGKSQKINIYEVLRIKK